MTHIHAKFVAAAMLGLSGLLASTSAQALSLTLPTTAMDANSIMSLSEMSVDAMDAAGISMSALGNAYAVSGSPLPTFDLPITEVSVNLSLIPYSLTPTAGEAMGAALQISRGTNSLVLANFQIDYSSEHVLADVIVGGITTTGMAIYSFDQATQLDMSLQGLTLNLSQVLNHLYLTTAAQDSFASALKLSKTLKGVLSMIDFGTISIDVNAGLRRPVTAAAFTAAMVPVPEPGPVPMMALGLVAMVWVVRRKLEA